MIVVSQDDGVKGMVAIGGDVDGVFCVGFRFREKRKKDIYVGV